MALVVAPVMRVFYFVARPLVDLFNGMGNLLLKPFGIPPAREAGHAPDSEDELRTLGDRRVREVMVPRHRAIFVTTGTASTASWRPCARPACGRHEATVGGVVLKHLGRLPEPGEEVSVDGVRFQVLAAKDAQIQELRLLRDAPPGG